MRIIRFNPSEGTVKLRVETFDDLWAIQRVTFVGDSMTAESRRKFKSNESDKGEFKDVMITLTVEKTEPDKNAGRLRATGKITHARPMEYVSLNSYHTLNVAPDDVVTIKKEKWPDYMVKVLKDAVSDSRKPRLGLIVADDEKALPAYLLGYGIKFESEMYSSLSKRMSQKDFTAAQNKYYDSILREAKQMDVDTVIIASPGFTSQDVKKYAADTGATKGSEKRIIYEAVSNAERSGVYELIKSDKVENLLHRERIRREFKLMDEFLTGLSSDRSKHGVKAVSEALDSYLATKVFVNDSVLGDASIQKALATAEARSASIEVFNSNDEVGQQLHSFGDIACV